MRLDAFLARKYPETSRATFQRLIEKGRVEVNSTVAKSARQEVAETDSIDVRFPRKKTFAKEIKEFAKNIIYEDENVVVINKPTGILTHSKGELSNEFTAADFFREKTTFGADTNRPGIVHRLDRATSGVMIGVKNPAAAKLLQKQFADRKTKKTYLALVEKVPKNLQARIDLPIGRDPKHPARFRVDAKGKSAITDYEVKQVFADNSALVELRPLTGRTHQLRVHMAYVGAPIVGDIVYGKPAERLFLHAAKLEITIPGGQRKVFEAPLPADFEREIDARSAD